jgi:hypothetical protein
MLCGLSVCDLGATTVLYFNVEYEYVAQGNMMYDSRFK